MGEATASRRNVEGRDEAPLRRELSGEGSESGAHRGKLRGPWGTGALWSNTWGQSCLGGSHRWCRGGWGEHRSGTIQIVSSGDPGPQRGPSPSLASSPWCQEAVLLVLRICLVWGLLNLHHPQGFPSICTFWSTLTPKDTNALSLPRMGAPDSGCQTAWPPWTAGAAHTRGRGAAAALSWRGECWAGDP